MIISENTDNYNIYIVSKKSNKSSILSKRVNRKWKDPIRINRINIYEKTKIITCDIIKERDTKELLESEHPFFAIPLRSVSLTFDL